MQELAPAHNGHEEVEENDIWGKIFHDIQGLTTIKGCLYIVAVFGEHYGKSVA